MEFLPILAVVCIGGGVVVLLVWYLLTQLKKAKKQIVSLEAARATWEAEKKNAESTRISLSTSSFFQSLYNLDAGVVIIDAQRKMVFVNRYVEELGGFSTSDFINKPISDFPITCTHLEGDLWQTVLAGSKTELPSKTCLKVRGGNTVPVWGAVTPLLDEKGRSMGAVMVLRDASLFTKAEEESQTFFSVAAHELRTPLTIIKATLSLLKESGAEVPATEAKEMLNSAYASAEQLTLLVNDLLQISRLERGKIEIRKEPMDLAGLIHEAIKEYLPLAQNKKLYLTMESEISSLMVSSDKTKTKEVLLNLISNAVKYTLQGGVTVELKEEEGKVMVLVADTGVGIPSHQQSLLFKKFQQIGAARSSSVDKSTGLGLFIAKEYAKALGGDILLQKSEPGQGTAFKFWLPKS